MDMKLYFIQKSRMDWLGCSNFPSWWLFILVWTFRTVFEFLVPCPTQLTRLVAQGIYWGTWHWQFSLIIQIWWNCFFFCCFFFWVGGPIRSKSCTHMTAQQLWHTILTIISFWCIFFLNITLIKLGMWNKYYWWNGGSSGGGTKEVLVCMRWSQKKLLTHWTCLKLM